MYCDLGPLPKQSETVKGRGHSVTSVSPLCSPHWPLLDVLDRPSRGDMPILFAAWLAVGSKANRI